MSLFNVQCGKTLLEVSEGCSFQDIIDLLLDEKIVGFSCLNTGKILTPLDQVTKSIEIIKIYNSHLIGNLLIAFSKILSKNIIDLEIKEEKNFIRECVVKFETEETYSELNFDQYESKIKEEVKNNKPSDNGILKKMTCENHLNLLPFSFSFEKVAQEELKGKKIQKFTIVVFQDSKDKEKYIENINLLKKIDHRYIGKNLEYFMMIPEAPGCPFWLPKGWKLYRKLESFVRKHAYTNFNEVKTPLVMSNEFWKKSGHLVSFKQNMMFVNMGGDENEDAALKPMNCPAHIEIFQRKLRSYKELPLRIAEFGCCHRYEPSGSLHGLMRVRSLTQDDGHIFCSLDQVKSETSHFLSNCIEIYKKLGFTDVNVILSTKPDNALGDPDEWILAEKYLSESLKEVGLNFTIADGEGAFYGPKIEMHVKDSIGRSWQLGTIQLDFVLPQRFELSFVDKNGEKGKVCMLHRAILGSLERFIGVLLEHTEGKLPAFLAPIQVVVCTVVEEFNEYAEKVHKKLLEHGIESQLDTRNETLGYKIREHKLAKVPMLIVVGKEEANNSTITLELSDKKMVLKLDEVEKIMGLFNEN
ncbi:threonine--tRNA ligase [Alphaproteobacteria bacterium endosymbiont of Tiliacea citrago]|uniref:threonine--tRNA ligase n=1 Tax=Alphaproteobacteria bacterium endosymbiont of Tiliacea citrago TaxID=3077944 RepID=UPI00313B2B04